MMTKNETLTDLLKDFDESETTTGLGSSTKAVNMLDGSSDACPTATEMTEAEETQAKWDAEAQAARERPRQKSPFHVMVDLETFGIGPAAFPIAIGAVKFDPADGPDPTKWDVFYQAVDPRRGPALGIDIQTIMYWMDKDRREALDYWLARPKIALPEALDGFAQWYGDESLPTWSRGPAFDAVILDTAYKVCGFPKRPWDSPRPWNYPQDRDVRTIMGLVPGWGSEFAPYEGFAGMQHDAQYDALKQTWDITNVAEALKLVLR